MPTMRAKVVSSLLLVLVLLFRGGASAGAADDIFGSFLDQVDVDVVEVDVMVTDGDGNPVTDLAREELELLVDGRPVEIRYFNPPAVIPAATPAVDSAEPGSTQRGAAAAPPTIALYVDQTTLQPGRRREALRGIRGFLDDHAPAGSRYLVATFDGQLRLLTSLTADRAAVERAFGELDRMAPRGLTARGEERALVEELERAPQRTDDDLRNKAPQGTLDRRFVPRAGIDPIARAGALGAEVQQLAERERQRQHQALGGIADLLAMLSGIEGRKAMLLTSGGFVTRPGAGLGEIWEARLGHLDTPAPLGGSGLDPQARALRLEFERLLRLAQAARVTVFTIDGADSRADHADVSQLRAGASAGALAGDAAAFDATGNLRLLATATGGQGFKASPVLGRSLAGVADDLASAYSLGFGAEVAGDDAFHRIEVRVLRPGLAARHREGFRPRSAAGRMEDAVLAAAAFAGDDNSLGARAVAGTARPRAASGDGMLVPVTVEVPIRNLAVLPGEQATARLAFHFAVRAADSTLLRLEPRQLPITIPNAQLAGALEQKITYRVELALPAGEHRLAIGVRDEIGGTRAAFSLPLSVPPR